MRRMLASASVEGYLSFRDHKFLKETQDNPEFASDLLHELRNTLQVIPYERSETRLTDPIRKQRLFDRPLHLSGW